ncbi:MAG: DUF2182 domain-containing protein [Hyphomicrobiales bacterium]|nr:DUF2182 domain-containing protein [Hyphomicrobiales bacterium]
MVVSILDLARWERVIILLSLAFITVLAWSDLAYLGSRMGGVEMPAGSHAWGHSKLVSAAAMWAVMMVAMMVPTAAPMVLLYAAAQKQTTGRLSCHTRTAAFLGGYLLTWVVFGLLAALLQMGLAAASLYSPTDMTAAPVVAAVFLFATGVYQWTPLKDACLDHCRSPFLHLMAHWRPGLLGGARMGATHGLYCIGCCWLVMILMFVVGTMNLAGMAGLTLLIMAEKVMPGPIWLPRAFGALCLIGGGLIVCNILA